MRPPVLITRQITQPDAKKSTLVTAIKIVMTTCGCGKQILHWISFLQLNKHTEKNIDFATRQR